MDTRAVGDVSERVRGLVSAILRNNSISQTVTPDARLADVGLASMDMVNLMLAVEAEFDIMIPQAQITPENFQSVATVERLILSLISPAAPGAVHNAAA